MTVLTCAANANFRMEIGECLLNLVAEHQGGPLAVAPLLGRRPSISGFEDSKSVSWQEILTFEANGAVELRARALIGRRTREMKNLNGK
jgi:hypothetical protein